MGQPAVLADKMVQLLTDDALCQQMKQRSRDIIAHKHNVHTYVQGINDAVAYAAGQQSRRSLGRLTTVDS